jgi:hypothetical protein
LLVGAGTSFGAISCFALHFIGTPPPPRALRPADGPLKIEARTGNNSLLLLRPASATEPARYLSLAYDPGFTILSLVVSVLRCVRWNCSSVRFLR